MTSQKTGDRIAENWGQNHGARKWLRTLAELVASQQQAFLRFLWELAARVAGNRTLGNFSTSDCKALNDNDLRQWRSLGRFATSFESRSYAQITAVIMIGTYFGLYFFAPPTRQPRLLVRAGFCVIFPLWFFRYAHAVWIAFDERFDPWRHEEEAEELAGR
jgi:hypothetical protein